MPASSLTNDTRVPPQASALGLGILTVGLVAVVLIAKPWESPDVLRSYALWGVLVGVVALSWLAGSSFKVAEQWEKAVVLRFGAYRGLRGPGCFFIIPIVEYVSHHVDQRIRARQSRPRRH